ncbi:MAG: hypothetical protein GXY27_04735 [Erysipelotrichaceae bacterium]|jgi:hypothetical protein|nr:hypothetical protein [Erysipelotrichaceae bacterium]
MQENNKKPNQNNETEVIDVVQEVVVPEGEGYPIDPKTETIKFPWSILIICGILIVLMVVCFVVIMMVEGQ